jgi:hypothetical protein
MRRPARPIFDSVRMTIRLGSSARRGCVRPP